MRNRLMLVAVFILIASCAAYSQTTEFTFQGSLKDSAAPANGTYDLEFALFDTASGGNQIGPTIDRSAVTVTNGIFSSKLDFGNQFPGADRFLEVRVRVSGQPTYVTLLPRQTVNSSPYSIKSLTADSASNAANAANFTGTLAGDVTGTQSATVIANNAVTASKIAGGQVVTSLNGLKDNVTLAAGSNITLTPSGNTLTIASTADNGSILNQTTQQAGANFNIGGNGVVAGTMRIGNPSFPTAKLAAGGADTGIYGEGNTYGVYGKAPGGGVVGITDAGTGVAGQSTSGSGVTGTSSGAGTYGVYGNAPGAGVVGITMSGTGVAGQSSSGSGVTGQGFKGVFGISNNTTTLDGVGVEGVGGTGVSGQTIGGHGVSGQATGSGTGVLGDANSGYAVIGQSKTGVGVQGQSIGNDGVQGISSGAGHYGVYGSGPGAGVVGITDEGTGVAGQSTGGAGVTGVSINWYGVYGASNNSYAGYFVGKVRITDLPGGATSGQVCYNSVGDILACSSSLRFKKNIRPFFGGMDLIKKLRPITYDWKDDSGRDVGLGAEDVAKIDPLFAALGQDGQVVSVKYDRLAVVFINALKEQEAKIEMLQSSNALLTARLSTEIRNQQLQIKKLTDLVRRSNKHSHRRKR